MLQTVLLRRACKTTVLASLLVPATALVAAGCGEGPESTRISITRRVEVAAVRPSRVPDTAGEPAPLRVAIAGILSPTRTLDGYHDLLGYMGQRLNQPVPLIQRGTYAEINGLLKDREIDLAFVCAGALSEGEREFGMEALVVPEVRGRSVYYSYLIVNRKSQSGRLEDLLGGSFAFSDPLSNTGRLVPVYQLALRGQTPERFFRSTVFTYSHDNSILAVADGLADAAAVDSLVYDYLRARNPEAVAETRVIQRWGPYGIPPVVVHPNLDPEQKRALKEFLLTIHADPEGKAILDRLLIDRFVLVDPGLFRSIREMEARVRRR